MGSKSWVSGLALGLAAIDAVSILVDVHQQSHVLHGWHWLFSPKRCSGASAMYMYLVCLVQASV